MSGLERLQDNPRDLAVREPQRVLEMVQRRSYRTKMAIMLTCKHWRALEYNSFFRFLCFRAPSHLCDILDRSAAAATTVAASLGWWTRRIHLAGINFRGPTMRQERSALLQDTLVRILRHCPNVEIFVVQWPLDTSTFGTIADALVRHAAHSLRTLYIHIQGWPALHKLVATLPALPYVCAAHVRLAPSIWERHLPTPDGPPIRLPHLQQLSLSGRPQQLIHVARHWYLPALRAFSLSCETRVKAYLPATSVFLAAHGAQLTTLELCSWPAMPLAHMLAACPALTTLAFNGDWAFDLPGDTGALQGTPPFAHARLARVGLHGLGHACDPSAKRSETVRNAARMNERALALLSARGSFPALMCVRLLRGDVVRERARARAQADGDGAARRSARTWARWEGILARRDPAGGLLG
ncbi:hypothetical protein B0H15DRAFT_285112 [Mycena belliarum]|uniref:F-box domain-containing protein n=1 Tax=Mycena belliarum TaxID=1033014 RepID=A0AAD6XQZ1_9AGAR|nr:hypothetical protein B0H15DRAFT_285112 [Mycena belliae]